MARNKQGKHSFILPEMPVITHWASVSGKKESEGPLATYFDVASQDTFFGQKTWEQAEKQMQKLALDTLMKKAGLHRQQIGMVFSGDLLNQCIGSSFTLRNTGIPHLGLYGACSTMAESLLLASMTVCGGFSDRIVAMTSSHFASSERQYRFPLGYGGQRPPTAQWTVTGSGAALVCSAGTGPRIESCTIGTVTDLGIKDANNMGAAMAPAAHEAISAYFKDTGTSPRDYDLILTGDLGKLGHAITKELFARDGIDMGDTYQDCGLLLYDLQKQDMHAGASGCGCSASVLNGYLLTELRQKKWKRILFAPTGALLSPISSFQGESIPGICHVVCISTTKEG